MQFVVECTAMREGCKTALEDAYHDRPQRQ